MLCNPFCFPQPWKSGAQLDSGFGCSQVSVLGFGLSQSSLMQMHVCVYVCICMYKDFHCESPRVLFGDKKVKMRKKSMKNDLPKLIKGFLATLQNHWHTYKFEQIFQCSFILINPFTTN